MKVVLAGINARYTHSTPALYCLRGAIEEAWRRSGLSGKLTIKEYYTSQDRLGIVQDIVLSAPEALLLSVYIWNGELIGRLLSDLRALLPSCRIILGGPEVSYVAEAWISLHPEIDLIVRGAGEEAIARLAAAEFDTSIFGTKTPSIAPLDFGSQAFAYRDSDFFGLEHRYIYYESSRGCPFSCSYCLSSRSDQALVAKESAVVIAELELLLAHDPLLVKFVDRSFNADPARAREIWRWLIEHERDKRTRFHFELHPGLLGEDDYSLLDSAPPGLFQFEIGIQTIHARTRALIGRGGHFESERAAIIRLAASGAFHLHLDMIVGLPGEGMEEISASFDAIALLAEAAALEGSASKATGIAFKAEGSATNAAASTSTASAPARGHSACAEAIDSRQKALSNRQLAHGASSSGAFSAGSRDCLFQIGFLKGLPGTRLREEADRYGMVFQSSPPYEILKSDRLSVERLIELGRIEELYEAIGPSGKLAQTMRRAREGSESGEVSLFQLYRELQEYCGRAGFDIRTRNEPKLTVLLEAWLAEREA